MPNENEDNINELKRAIEEQLGRDATVKEVRRTVLTSIELCLSVIKRDRPNDRSELDRRYAIVITDFEKVMAYFKTYIVEEYMLSSISQSPSKVNE